MNRAVANVPLQHLLTSYVILLGKIVMFSKNGEANDVTSQERQKMQHAC